MRISANTASSQGPSLPNTELFIYSAIEARVGGRLAYLGAGADRRGKGLEAKMLWLFLE